MLTFFFVTNINIYIKYTYSVQQGVGNAIHNANMSNV